MNTWGIAFALQRSFKAGQVPLPSRTDDFMAAIPVT
jgi:hypothetical protein